MPIARRGRWLSLPLRRRLRPRHAARPVLPPGEAAAIRLLAARTSGVRRLLAVHLWLVMKEPGGAYERWDVVGRRARTGRIGLQRNVCPPDDSWAGHAPRLVLALDGAAAEQVLPALRAAIAAYPDRNGYRAWPGPNCNSFVAWLAREVPGLHASLPPLAIGKDYLGSHKLLARTPSGTGWQLSLLGLAGITLAAGEGLELMLGGLVLGVGWRPWRLKLPLAGEIGGGDPGRGGLGQLSPGARASPSRPAPAGGRDQSR